VTDRTVREVPGYGASLRKQIKATGWSQARLADASGVSRQTVSRAVNQNRVSPRTEELIATALARGSGVDTPPNSALAGGRAAAKTRHSPIRSSTLCNAADLVAWAALREAQGLLPVLVRRLIFATSRGLRELQGFRDEEGVQLSGWDGIVHAGEDISESTPFVPPGASGWEMGTGAGAKRKAERDLQDRAEKPEPLDPEDTTFVFVTPRRFSGEQAWARQQTELGPFRRVRVVDANGLVAWMEQAPAVHVWFSRRIDKTPSGSIDLESYWREWAEETHPPITSRLLLSDRDDAVSEIRDRLGESSQSFAIRTESRSEAVAVLYCVIRELPLADADHVLARSVVVESRDALRQLTAFPSRLLLVPAPAIDADELVTAAARAGHTVVVPLDEADAEHGVSVQLAPVSRDSVAEVLGERGIDQEYAYKLAGLARRSLTAFRRKISHGSGLQQPEWSKPAVGRTLLPAVFAGSWNDTRAGDREVLARLSRCAYEDVGDRMVRWSVGADPAIRRRNHAWYLVSHEDAWRALRRYLTPDDFTRFEEIALDVMRTPDPAFDLPRDERWMAGALDVSPKWSNLLLDGLAQSLLIMGVQEDKLPFADYSERDVSARIVRKVLMAANEDWRIWASLSSRLPQLAEAAPDSFLDSVEEGVIGPRPVLARLFTDHGSAMFHASPHLGLLHALEVLAWSRDHVGRVVSLLAHLERVDPGSPLRTTAEDGGRLANRPSTSLKAIFRSWQPQTSATLEQRLQLLTRLRHVRPELGWAVMLSMLPEMHAVGFPSAQPKVRDWAENAERSVSLKVITDTTKEVVYLLRSDAGSDAKRWAELVEHLNLLPHDEHTSIVEDLEKLDAQGLDGPSLVWEALRALVARHRALRTAEWAMPEACLARLDAIRDRFAPDDPVARSAWLFGPGPYLTDGSDVTETSWDAQQVALSTERIKAVSEVVEERGLGGLRAIASEVEQPWEVGRAAASVDNAHPLGDELLASHLGDENRALAMLAFGYAAGHVDAHGDDWVLGQLQRENLGLSALQQAAMLCALPAMPATWRLAANYGEATSLAYWRQVVVHKIAAEHVAEGALELVRAGRPFAAIDLLGLQRSEEDSMPLEVIAEVLEAAVATDTDDTEVDGPSPSFAHAAERLLDTLVVAGFDRIRVAGVEWRLLPFLRRLDWTPRALHHLLSESPEFFAEVVSVVYRAGGDEPPGLDQQDELRARAGHSLLKSWRALPAPARSERPDREYLREWISSAERALDDVDRLAIGRHAIGEMLSESPPDPDGTWPCTPVRDILDDIVHRPEVEEGLRLGVLTGRGLISKHATEGGEQERELAEQYEGLAAAVRFSHPRTARLLRRIADHYGLDAGHEDHRAGMLEDLD